MKINPAIPCEFLTPIDVYTPCTMCIYIILCYDDVRSQIDDTRRTFGKMRIYSHVLRSRGVRRIPVTYSAVNIRYARRFFK